MGADRAAHAGGPAFGPAARDRVARRTGRDLIHRADRLSVADFALAEDPDRVKRLNEIGVNRVVPMFPPEKADKVLPIIDRWTTLMKQING